MEKVKLKQVINDLSLEEVQIATNIEEVYLLSGDINRPGLQLTGYYNKFSPERLQIIGEQEWYYLDELKNEDRKIAIKKLFEKKIPALLFLNQNLVHDEIIELARNYDISLIRTKDSFSKFAVKFRNYIDRELAPSIRKHGVLLDVFGVGVLITGVTGIGKSEAALNLISNGSKLVSDDSIIIKNVDNRLIGTSPDITKYFMEIRGVGIIDIQKLFGIGFVMEDKEVEMIVNLEAWDKNKDYERLGIDNEYEEILGKNVVKYIIPVKPGRDTALIIEAATKNFKLKEGGYNPAVELNDRILKYKYKKI